MNEVSPLFLLALLCHLVPLFTSIDYIHKSNLLNDVDRKYQLASFTNIITKSRYLDLVFIGPTHESVTVKSYNAQNESYSSNPGYQYSFQGSPEISGFKIVGILPADYNNDKTTDVMVVFAKTDSSAYKLAIIWNRHDKFNDTPSYINETFSDVPHLVDFDGDLFVDFICAQENVRYFWINDKAHPGTFAKRPISSNDTVNNVEIDVSKGETLYAYGDLNGDCAADLFMITKLKNGSSVFQVYEAKETELVKSDLFIPTFPADKYGAPLIEDMDGNGKMDIVIPGCTKISKSTNICLESKIVIYYNDPCHAKSSDKCVLYRNSCTKFNLEDSFETYVFDKFEHDKSMYGFLSYDQRSDIYSSRYMIRSADVDSDGHVDLVAILKYDNSQQVVILKNVADEKANVGGRSFKLEWRDDLVLDSDQTENYQPYALAAVDALGSGTVQFFIVGRNKDNLEDFSLSLLAPKDMLDTFWLKVTVLCYKCDESSTTVIGANVFYYTTGYKGDEQVAYASQSSHLAPFSLQAPYMLFGLGQQANYIEYIKVAYRNTVRYKDKTHDMFQFDQLVPNAQVFAIPLESMWRLVMMVVPGKTMWETLLVLGICCVVCMIIILVLHIKEKKEDEREKRKFNAKFNFDAM